MMLAQFSQFENRTEAIYAAMDCLDKEKQLRADVKMLFLFLLQNRMASKNSDFGDLSKKLKRSPKWIKKYLRVLKEKGFLTPSDLLEIRPASLN